MRPIPDCPNYYASEEGHIYCDLPMGRSKVSYTLRKLSPNIQTTGKYYCLSVKFRNGVRKTQRVHRLVCLAYHGIPEFDNATVSHLDGNWKNNRPDNLKWESYSENHNRKKEHGTDDIGTKNSRAKINLEQLKEIRKLLSEKELTHKEIGERFGVNRVFITKISSGQRYKGQG